MQKPDITSVRKLQIICLLMIAVGLFSCGQTSDKPVETKQPQVSKPAVLPNFNADTAYAYMEKQMAFGPRVPNTKAHDECAAFLEKSVRKYIPDVIAQKGMVRAYNDKTLNITNIIAAFHPERADRVLICAHWDSRHIADHDPDPANRNKPVPAANDGASGPGVMLEIARQLTLKDPGIGVDLVFLDAEDYGQPEDAPQPKEDTWCLGTQYWAKNPHKPGYTARFGILLDMVGAKNATFHKEGESMSYAPDVVKLVWETAAWLGYSHIFIDETGGSVTDDHIYINEILKIPTIDIIQQDMSGEHPFFPYWHTTKDDMDYIDKTTLLAVGNTVLAVLDQIKPN